VPAAVKARPLSRGSPEPLVVLQKKLVDRGVKEKALEKIRNEVEAEVAEAVEFAQNSPWPDPAEAYTDVFAL
jgi:TPP-dependent pyruvate/acetoin dehydrogenase alpha subunit